MWNINNKLPANKIRLLYVYEERIPIELKKYILSYIPKNLFDLKHMTYLETKEEMIKKIRWSEVILFAPGRFISNDIMYHATNVKLMQLWSSGFDKFNIAAADEIGIPVANNGGANTSSVAEHAILLMLAASRKLPDSHQRTISGNWNNNKHGMDMFMLQGKKLGIIGFGKTGRQLASKIRGFKMKVYYYDIKKINTKLEKKYEVKYLPFEVLLKESDIITLHLHYNKETENIIGQRELSLMKKSAVLINVSRAQLVEQKALIKALNKNKLRFAGLDTYLEEPTSPYDPLLKLPNIVATHHIAGSNIDAYKMVMDKIIPNIIRAASGKKPLYIVNHV